MAVTGPNPDRVSTRPPASRSTPAEATDSGQVPSEPVDRPGSVAVLLPAKEDPSPWRRVIGSPRVLFSAADLAVAPETEWVLVAEAGVVPEPHLMVRLLAELGDSVAAAYCDFETVDTFGAPLRTNCPGDWSVERSRWSDYTGPATLIRRGFVLDHAASDHLRRDAMRAAARSGRVAYIRHPLYSVRTWHEEPIPPGLRATMLESAGAPYSLAADGRSRISPTPSISVVIPTQAAAGNARGRTGPFIDTALESILDTHGDVDLQFVLVVDADAPRPPFSRWQRRLGDHLRVVDYSEPFNFSDKINEGVAAAEGDIVAILNDDIEIITPDALRTLAVVAGESDVGAVGALLRYEDGSIQHAGQAFADGGVHHIGAHRGEGWVTEHSNLLVDRDVTGVTAACLVQRRDVWQHSGGLDPMLPVNFNDVDYCWRLRQQGLRIVQCNNVELFHFESKTRSPGAQPWEVERLRSRVGAAALDDDGLTPEDAAAPAADRWERQRQRWHRLRRGISATLSTGNRPQPRG